MGITSKAKNTLKSSYKSVKKSFNSFLKKLGFSSKEAAQVSSEFATAMSETIGNHLKDNQYREVLKEIITKDNEPIYENLQPLKPHRPAPPIPGSTESYGVERRTKVDGMRYKIQKPKEAPPSPPSLFQQEIMKMKNNLRKVDSKEPQVKGINGQGKPPIALKPNLTDLNKAQLKSINEQLNNLDQQQTNQHEQESELDK
ncbi:hypothetical protein SKUN_00965 [Spiroplasma kunkelii CR2-3x]|uniref:Uncharacterized protein n=1 Tax=Spiroplasma kunkelii CR2-3x TaxID=273035 RepID=A0A0K2JHF8_SPIKU|nr:hypothetical protein [Spiroplasma kunkelii]ALA97852.1 hypothetical protein SKUN_00965 [Spiroplasma kunkelii CR2-3x]